MRENLPVDDEQVSSSDEDDDQPPQAAEGNICSICLQGRDENYILIPCGHASLCMNCANELLNRGHNCHMCRAVVTSIHRVFL